MAFVFRSQKLSIFDSKKQQQILNQSSTFNKQHSKLNGTCYSNTQKTNQYISSQKKIFKGLPSLLQKNQNGPLNESVQKQNIMFVDQIKTFDDIKKSSKEKLNFFFLSKVARDPYKLAFQQRNLNKIDNNIKNEQIKKNLVFQQNMDKSKTSYPHQKNRYFQDLNKNINRVVNKNILNAAYQTSFQFKNSSILNQLNEDVLQKINVDCVKQCKSQIKRKSSPPKNINKKISTIEDSLIKRPKDQKQIATEKQESEIQMKTSLSSTNNILLRKTLEQRKISHLKKGSLRSSFYKQPEYQNQDSQEQQQNQYSTPGPGSYQNSVNLRQKKSFRSRKQKFAKIFVSPLQRFKTDDVKFHQIAYINEYNDSKQKRLNHMFLSKTPKFMEFQKKSNSPPPGSYNVRQSIQHNIVSNLLKNANVPNFSSSLPRFNYPSIKPSPGPGQYNTDVLQKLKLQQSVSQASYNYKSKVKRCLNPCLTEDKIKENNQTKVQIQLLSNKKGENTLIHARQQNFDSSQFFTAPPFLSGVQRFNEISYLKQNQITNDVNSQKRCQKKSNPNNHPFNSTQKRKIVDIIGSGIGIGSYLVQKDGWNKKSYNIFFH